MIVLNDSNEIVFKLVDSNVWNWMMDGKGDEDIPDFITNHPENDLGFEDFEGLHFGSINDRANMAPGQIFESEKELQEYIGKNSVEIAEKYQGNLE